MVMGTKPFIVSDIEPFGAIDTHSTLLLTLNYGLNLDMDINFGTPLVDRYN